MEAPSCGLCGRGAGLGEQRLQRASLYRFDCPPLGKEGHGNRKCGSVFSLLWAIWSGRRGDTSSGHHYPRIVVIRVEQAPGHSGGKTQGVDSLAASSGDPPAPQPATGLCQTWAWERGGLPSCFLGRENTRTSGLKERKAASPPGWTLLCCSRAQMQAPTVPWFSLHAPSCSQHPPK